MNIGGTELGGSQLGGACLNPIAQTLRYYLYNDGNIYGEFDESIILSGSDGYYIQFKYKGSSNVYRTVFYDNVNGYRVARIDKDGVMRFYQASEEGSITGTVSITDNKEHLIRLEVMSSSAKLYIDGELDVSYDSERWADDLTINQLFTLSGVTGQFWDIDINGQAQYAMGEGAKSVLSDSVNNNDITLYNVQAGSWIEGIV